MAKVVSNKRQMEKLVALMEANPDIAKGICGKALGKTRWEKFTVELNSLGPPMRTYEKWIKVWADLKFKIKKKKTENKTEINATGGGPNRLHSFSNLEESVIALLSMNASIDPPGQEIGEEVENSIAVETMQVEEELDPEPDQTMDSRNISLENSTQPRSSEKKTKKSNEERIALLIKQTVNQEEFYSDIKVAISELNGKISSLEQYTKKVYYQLKDSHKELLAIKKEKLQIQKEDIKCRQRDRILKLKLIQQKLELKKTQIELQLQKV